MKNKYVMLMLSIFFCINILVLNVNMVNAEMYSFTSVNLDYEKNTTTHYYSFQFRDDQESLDPLSNLRAKLYATAMPLDIILYYQVNPLPYNLAGYGYVGNITDCNLTIIHDANVWDKDGFITSTSSIKTSLYFSTNVSADFGKILYTLHNRDVLSGYMTCHYTNNESLYVESVLIGKLYAYYPPYRCADCTKYSLEQLVKEGDNNMANAIKEGNSVANIQKIIRLNYKFLYIVHWTFRIFMLGLSVYMLVLGVYFVYRFIKDLSRVKYGK
jgi:hypothetical protein